MQNSPRFGGLSQKAAAVLIADWFELTDIDYVKGEADEAKGSPVPDSTPWDSRNPLQHRDVRPTAADDVPPDGSMYCAAVTPLGEFLQQYDAGGIPANKIGDYVVVNTKTIEFLHGLGNVSDAAD